MSSPGLRVGPYELLHKIASGGMGEVFIARRTGAQEFEKRVALKLLLPHLADDAELTQRFFDEARLAARMNHPNVVQLFDLGDDHGRPWVAMALVEGVSLALALHRAAKQRALVPLPLVRLIACGLLDGLGYAHALTDAAGTSLGVVHRDVSATNVLVTAAGAVLLTDFGIARATLNHSRTEPGHVRGKLAYMAPEQRTGLPVDARADLFSAAVTLYELTCLKSPFLRATHDLTLDAVLHEQPPDPRALRPDVSERFAAALLKSLSKSPEQRHPTAAQLRDALLDGPLAAAPELGDWVQRLASDELQRFGSKPPAATQENGTATLNPRPPEATTEKSAPPKRRRALLLIPGAAAVLAVGIALTLEQQPEPTPQAPAMAVRDMPAPAPAPAPEAREREPQPEAPTPKPEPAPQPKPAHAKRQPPKAEAKPEDPAPTESIGYLSADADPWAWVLLDGKPIDRTPFFRYPVTAGTHAVTFRAADGRTIERSIDLRRGETRRERVDFTTEAAR